MNYREPPHLSAGLRRALHCLSLLLLPAMAPEGVHALPRSRPPGADRGSGAGSIPYLPVAGAPPLRFQEPAPPPDLVTRPAAAAPPVPALTPTETSVAEANAAAARSAAVAEPEAVTPERVAERVPTPTTLPETPETPTEETPAVKTPPPILPDRARPTVRPEDFLPFFQLPGLSKNPADVTVLVPATAPTAPEPGTLPPSSATYTQTPK